MLVKTAVGAAVRHGLDKRRHIWQPNLKQNIDGSHLLEWWLIFAGQVVQNHLNYSSGNCKPVGAVFAIRTSCIIHILHGIPHKWYTVNQITIMKEIPHPLPEHFHECDRLYLLLSPSHQPRSFVIYVDFYLEFLVTDFFLRYFVTSIFTSFFINSKKRSVMCYDTISIYFSPSIINWSINSFKLLHIITSSFSLKFK